jgi:tRNA pseudouridine38-40 synthase
MRYKLIVQYDGTDFHGWQIQARERTVQGVLEDAVAQLFGESTRVASAGRTDAGVHASGQVASFSTRRERPPDTVLNGLNALTPADIAIRSAEVVDEWFDPRREARSRLYRYRIWNTRWLSPFWRRYTWHVVRALAVEPMAAAAGVLVGTYDFTSFRAADCDAEHPIRAISRSDIEIDDCMVVYTVEANAFLRHMVRNIIGTLVEVGLGERDADSIAGLIEKRDRNLAGATAPAAGLCLEQVRYSENERG